MVERSDRTLRHEKSHAGPRSSGRAVVLLAAQHRISSPARAISDSRVTIASVECNVVGESIAGISLWGLAHVSNFGRETQGNHRHAAGAATRTDPPASILASIKPSPAPTPAPGQVDAPTSRDLAPGSCSAPTQRPAERENSGRRGGCLTGCRRRSGSGSPARAPDALLGLSLIHI